MDSTNKPAIDLHPGSLITGFLLGTLLIILGIQVLFPKIPIPIAGILLSAVSLVDFIAHEIGHVAFGFMGEYVSVLGGTLAQLFLPSVCLLITIRRKSWFSVSIFTFWVGQSLIQISTYVRDARTQGLKLFSPGTLFGGENPIHDWHYLLDKVGLLWADQYLGWSIFALGLIMLLLAAGVAFAKAVGYPKNSN
jgi:hypothetical protein